MKIKVVILSCLIAVVILTMGYEKSLATAKPEKTDLKIGVVSVLTILKDCKSNAKFREEISAE